MTRAAKPAPRPWLWLLDVLIVCFGGLIAGLVLGRGGEFTLLGVPVHVRSLYNPVLILTALVMLRMFIWWRPHFELPVDSQRSLIKVILIAALACAGPLAPVLYGLGGRIAEGRFVTPPIFWRSSPRGVDLLSFMTPNPLHPIVRWFTGDPLVMRPTQFVEYTASLSLVSLLVIAHGDLARRLSAAQAAGSSSPSASRCWRWAHSFTWPASTRTCRDRGRCCDTRRGSGSPACRADSRSSRCSASRC